MVLYLNGGMKTWLKRACLWSKMSGIQMVRQVTWLYHLNTEHPYCRVFRWIRYSGAWYSDYYCIHFVLSVTYHTVKRLFKLDQLRSKSIYTSSPQRTHLNKFYLLSVDNLLLEDSVVVSDAVAVCRHGQGRHRIQETGCKTAQTSIAEASISLNVLQLFYVETQLWGWNTNSLICYTIIHCKYNSMIVIHCKYNSVVIFRAGQPDWKRIILLVIEWTWIMSDLTSRTFYHCKQLL